MKKRLVTLLLAGLILASLNSCDKDEKPAETSVEETETQTPTTEATEVVTPSDYVDKNDYIYTVVDDAQLRTEGSGKATVAKKVAILTKLHRVAANNEWHKVEYDGGTYYIAIKQATTDDVKGESFTAVEEKTVYINTTGVRLRQYASTNDTYSAVKKTMTTNDTVIIVAKNSNWSKVKLKAEDTTYLFVMSKFLSDTKITDPDVVPDGANFYNISGTMYATCDLFLRKGPSQKATVVTTVKADDAVTLISKCDEEINGIVWCKVCYDQVHYGYISYNLLSSVQGTATSLEDLLRAYPEFTKLDTPITKYCSAETSLNVRTSPSTSSSIKGELTHAEKVTVYAVGSGWSVIDYQKESKTYYCFVSSAYLTTKADGSACAMTYDEIYATYGETYDFVSETYNIKGTAYCYVSEDVGEANYKDATKKVTKAELTLENGVEVLVVAKQCTEEARWWIVEIEDQCYFVLRNSFQ